MASTSNWFISPAVAGNKRKKPKAIRLVFAKKKVAKNCQKIKFWPQWGLSFQSLLLSSPKYALPFRYRQWFNLFRKTLITFLWPFCTVSYYLHWEKAKNMVQF